MKKSLFSLLLVLVLLVAVSAFAVEADDVTPIAYKDAETVTVDSVEYLNFYCEHCKDNVNWQLWNGARYGESTAEGDTSYHKHQYIAKDMTLGSAKAIQARNLHLYIPKGVTLSSNKGSLRVSNENSIELAVMGEGTFKGTAGSGGLIVANGTPNAEKACVYLYGITLDASEQTSANSRAITVKGEKYEVYIRGTTVIGQKPKTTDKFGNTISVINGGKVFMEDGIVKDGALTTTGGNLNGGNVYVASGSSFTMSGGTIQNGGNHNGTGKGGNVYITGSDTTFTMNGGTITGGKAYKGGNVYIDVGATFTMNEGIVEHGDGGDGGNFFAVGTYAYNEGTNASTVTKATLTIGSEAENQKDSDKQKNPMVVAGKATEQGGNIFASEGAAVTMWNGTMTSVDNNGTNHGTAANGINIALVHASGIEAGTTQITTIILKGGTISGAIEKNGSAVWVYGDPINDSSRARIDLGNVTIENPNRENYVDISNALYAPVRVLTGYTKSAVIKADAWHGAEEDGKDYVNRGVITHTNYANTGNVYVRDSQGDRYMLAWTSQGGKKNLSAVTAAIYNGTELVDWGLTAQTRIEDCEAGQYVKLYKADMELDLTALAAPVAVDFNGKDTTIIGAANLKGIDSATNDYDETGAAVVTVDDAPVLNTELAVGGDTVRKYLALANDDGTYSFHRYWIGITESALRLTGKTDNPGIFYKAGFYGDQAVAEAVNAGDWGIKLYYIDNEELKPVAQQYHTNSFKDVAFDSGKDGNGGRYIGLHGYLTNEGMENDRIVAKPYITVGTTTIESTVAGNLSMQEALDYAVGQYNEDKLTPAQVTAVDAIFDNFSTKFTTLGWDFGYTKKTA